MQSDPERSQGIWVPLLLGMAVVAVTGVLAFGNGSLMHRGWHFLQTRPEQLFSRNTGLFLAASFAVLAVECWVLGYRQSSLFRLLHPNRSAMTDIVVCAVALCGLFGALTMIFSLGLSSVLSDLLILPVPRGALGLTNPLLQTFWALLAIDFAKYWAHYFQHRIPFWWEGHKFHHAATELNVITTFRGHPADNAVRILFLAIPLTLLDATADEILFLVFLLNVHAGITHSMLPWNFGWVGRWVLVSPVYHRIHHSPLPEHFDKNLASIFPIWDRLFRDLLCRPGGQPDRANRRGGQSATRKRSKRAVQEIMRFLGMSSSQCWNGALALAPTASQAGRCWHPLYRMAVCTLLIFLPIHVKPVAMRGGQNLWGVGDI